MLMMLALLLCGLGSMLHAQDAAAAPSPPDTSEAHQRDPTDRAVTAHYFNRDIITFRAELFGRTPEVRAHTAEQNIDRIAAKRGPAVVTFRDLQQATLVLLDGDVVCALTTDDLDQINGETMDQAQARIARALSNAVKDADAANSPRRLMEGILWSALATVIAIVLIGSVVWLGRRINRSLLDWLQGRLAVLRHESARQIALSVRTIGHWLVRIICLLIVLIVLEEWLRFVLGRFAYTKPWADAMRGWIVHEFEGWGKAIIGAVPGIVAAIIILLITRTLAQAITITFRGVQTGRFKILAIDSELAEPTRKIIVAVVWLFGVAMAYPYLPGAQTDAFKGLSVLVGLMISLGASSIVAQAASSFTILYSRTMRVGEVIKSGDTEGTVLQIGLFATRVRTLTGVEVSIPNSVVLSSQLHNYSRHPDGPGMWLETGVTIGYDTPWRQVQKLLLDGAHRTQNVSAEPAPFVLQTALSDFYVEYRLRVRITDLALRVQVMSELHANIQDEFNTAGVQIMSPHYEKDPAEPKIVPPEHWNG